MVLGIVVFGAVFLVGLAVGTITRRPILTAAVVFGAFSALVIGQAYGSFVAVATFALVILVALTALTISETAASIVAVRSPRPALELVEGGRQRRDRERAERELARLRRAS